MCTPFCQTHSRPLLAVQMSAAAIDANLQDMFHIMVVPALKEPDAKLVDACGLPMLERAYTWTVRAREWALSRGVTRSTTIAQVSSMTTSQENGKYDPDVWSTDPPGLKEAGGVPTIVRVIHTELSAYRTALMSSARVLEYFRKTRTSLFDELARYIDHIPWGNIRKNVWWDQMERTMRDALHLPSLGIYNYKQIRDVATVIARERILTTAQAKFHLTHQQIKQLFEMEAIAQAYDALAVDEKKAAADVGFRIANDDNDATATAAATTSGRRTDAKQPATARMIIPHPAFVIPPGSDAVWKLDETVSAESETLAKLASDDLFGERPQDLKLTEQIVKRVNYSRAMMVSSTESLKAELLQLYQIESRRYKLKRRYATYDSMQLYMSRLLEASGKLNMKLPTSLSQSMNETFIQSRSQMETAHDEWKRMPDASGNDDAVIVHWLPTVRATVVWNQWMLLSNGLQRLKTPGLKKEMPKTSVKTQMQCICDGLRKEMMSFWSSLGTDAMEDSKLAYQCVSTIHMWNQLLLSILRDLPSQCQLALKSRSQLIEMMQVGKPNAEALSLAFAIAANSYAVGPNAFPKHTSKLAPPDTLYDMAAQHDKLTHHAALEIALQLYARSQVKCVSL